VAEPRVAESARWRAEVTEVVGVVGSVVVPRVVLTATEVSRAAVGVVVGLVVLGLAGLDSGQLEKSGKPRESFGVSGEGAVMVNNETVTLRRTRFRLLPVARLPPRAAGSLALGAAAGSSREARDPLEAERARGPSRDRKDGRRHLAGPASSSRQEAEGALGLGGAVRRPGAES
jgi:hypothetical protein